MSYKLINGDCIDEMEKIPDKSIDFCFLDLPYCGIDNKSSEVACKWNTPIDLGILWKQLNRITHLTTPIFFTCSTRFGVALINSNPKNFRYDLVWEKSKALNFLNAQRMVLKKHEMVYVFYRKLPLYDLTSHKCIITEKKNKNKVLPDEPVVYNGIYRSPKDPSAPTKKFDPPLPTSVLKFNNEGGHHNTQKPLALIEWLLKYFSKEGDTILDPTAGSFSTALACFNMNRSFIGFERDIEIYNKGVERFNKHTGSY